jgi:hypothetical protein
VSTERAYPVDGAPVTQGDPASVDLDAIFARMDALEAWELVAANSR